MSTRRAGGVPIVRGGSVSTQSLTSRTIAGAGWLIAWRVVTRSLGLVSTLIMAHILMPADFGLIAMATTFSAGVDALSQLGLSDALVRRRGAPQDLFDTAFTLQLCRAGLTASILAAGAPAAVWWFGEARLQPVLLVLAAATLIEGCENIGIAEFRRNIQFSMQFRLQLVPRLFQVATTIVAALILRSYWALLAGILATKAARVVMSYIMHPYRPRLHLAGWRELAGFSFWTWMTALANLVWERCDPFVIGPAVGAGPLGIYLLAFELATLPVSELIAPAAEAMFAGFASAQNEGVSSTRYAPVVATSLFLVILPLVIGISACGGYVVAALLGPRWAAAQPLVSILAWMCVFSAFSWVSSAVLVANGYVRRNFIANLAAAVTRVVVLVTAVHATHRLDIIAAASAACLAAESCVFIGLLRGTGHVPLRAMAGGVLRGLAAGAAATAALALTGLGWQPVHEAAVPAILTGAAVGSLGIVVFVGVLAALWLASGRPEGAEVRIAGLAAQRLGLAR